MHEVRRFDIAMDYSAVLMQMFQGFEECEHICNNLVLFDTVKVLVEVVNMWHEFKFQAVKGPSDFTSIETDKVF